MAKYSEDFSPTYEKETALYDTGVIKNDINDAKGSAEKYITEINQNGIFVHTEDSENPNVPETAGNYGVHISDDVDIIRNGVNVASYGTSARIGVATSDHATIDSDGLTIYDSNSAVAALKRDSTTNFCCLELEDSFRRISSQTVGTNKNLIIECSGTEIRLGDSYGGINFDGDLYYKTHQTSIGTISSGSSTLDLTAANVSSFSNGAGVTLTPGVYNLIGQCTFPQRYKAVGDATEPDYTNLEIQLYNLTASEVIGRQKIVVYKNAATILQVAGMISIDAESSIIVRIAAGYCCDGCSTTIRAMRIL